MKCNGLALFAFSLLSIQAQPVFFQDIHARLLTPVASYSKVGQNLQVRTGAPLEFGTDAILAEGTILHGKVRAAHGVGIGIRHERAFLDLEFQRCNPPSQPDTDCSIELIEIENSREQVTKGSRIQGVLAASNPNALLQGIWIRPAGAFLHRTPTGLTGPVGALQSRIAPNPLGAAVTIASRLLLFSLPNAEIELPAGTELILRIKASADYSLPPAAHELPAPMSLTEEDGTYLRNIPTEIKNGSGNTVSDRINFAIRGTREEIEASFSAAGWTSADPLTRKSFAKCYAAFTSLRGYAQAPVSPLFYQHSMPDFVFQKSFNSMAKRHHIRFWRIADFQAPDEKQLWVAAATHDIGIAFDWNRFSLTHRVDEFLDKERSKVLNDLSAARCLRQLTMLDRPALAGTAATDGQLAVVTLQPCAASATGDPPGETLRKPRNPAVKRLVRRLVLETRQYVTRGNAYYLAYRGVRKAIVGLRRVPSLPVEARPINAFAAVGPSPAKEPVDRRAPQPLP